MKNKQDKINGTIAINRTDLLQLIKDDECVENVDVSEITNFFCMFDNATSFNQDISRWDVSNGTDFSWMFCDATSFNQDISKWDVSNGTSFSWMFREATSFNQDISRWDVSNGTSFNSMFCDTTSFNQDISRWDVSNGTSFDRMFRDATSFNQDISKWDVSNGIDFYNFSNSTLVKIPMKAIKEGFLDVFCCDNLKHESSSFEIINNDIFELMLKDNQNIDFEIKSDDFDIINFNDIEYFRNNNRYYRLEEKDLKILLEINLIKK